jgi:hypothetical protein
MTEYRYSALAEFEAATKDWTRVDLRPVLGPYRDARQPGDIQEEIRNWCAAHCIAGWSKFWYATIKFEDARDAVMFKLHWS